MCIRDRSKLERWLNKFGEFYVSDKTFLNSVSRSDKELIRNLIEVDKKYQILDVEN